MRVPRARRAALAVLAGLPMALPARAGTFVVDDDGGPGVDFTDLPPAIAAASPGDVLLVRPGSYSGFVLGKSLTLLGARRDAVLVGRPIDVDGSGVAGPIVLASLTVSNLRAHDAGAVVVLEDLVGTQAVVELCGDARFIGCRFGWDEEAQVDGAAAVDVRSSRAEFVRCGLDGPGGWCAEPTLAAPGCALSATDSFVCFARSSARGGDGHDWSFVCSMSNDYGGDGADGMWIQGSWVLVEGTPEDRIHGGDGGAEWGACGNAIVLDSASMLRHSNVTLSGGYMWGDPYQPCEEFQGNGQVDPAFPYDPTLVLERPASPGGAAHLLLAAPRGSTAVLELGRRARVATVPGVYHDQLTSSDRTVPLGVVPGSGEFAVTVPLPAAFPRGLTFFAQARVTVPGGQVRYTNSVPIVLH